MCACRSGCGVVEHRCCNCIADLDVVMMVSLSPLLISIPYDVLLPSPPLATAMM